MVRKTAPEGPPGTRVCKERLAVNSVHLPRNFNYHSEGRNAARHGIIISCVMRAIPEEGVRPEKTAVSYVKAPIHFSCFLNITQGGSRGGWKPVFTMQRAQFLRSTCQLTRV